MVGKILVGFVAIQHVAFFVLESFFWEHPIGRKIFRNSPETAALTAKLAVNQGVYNAFLAAGLIWSLVDSRPEVAQSTAFFFLFCVLIAGCVGAATASPRILWVQAAPAALALLVLWRAR
jgi:putative membrane protein